MEEEDVFWNRLEEEESSLAERFPAWTRDSAVWGLSSRLENEGEAWLELGLGVEASSNLLKLCCEFIALLSHQSSFLLEAIPMEEEIQIPCTLPLVDAIKNLPQNN